MKTDGWAFIFWVLLLLLVPSVASQSTADLIWDERERGELKTWRVLEENLEGENASRQLNVTWLDFSPYENAIPQSLLLMEIAATFTFQLDADGTWNYTVESDAFDIPDCFWHVTTRDPGGFLSGDLVAFGPFIVFCAAAVTIAEDAVFNIWINRTVLSGTPNIPVDAHISVQGDRGDFIVTSEPTAFELLTGVTGTEFLLFVVVIGLTIVLWSRAKDPAVQIFSGVLLMLFGAIAISLYAEWMGWVPAGAIMSVLGAYFIIRSGIDAMTNP